ncbi:MAG TPA: tetratricopeptide repeat protein [Bryobacteraceae bacterium]
MNLRLWSCLALFLVPCTVLVSAGQQNTEHLDHEFQAAVAQYDAGHLPEAAAALEKLVREVPTNFEVHELLGLIYSEQSQDALANQHLQTAVRLNPGSAAARTNLAANLVHLGKLEDAQAQLKRAVTLEPRNYDANHNLGEIYVRMGKITDAVPFLRAAQQVKPTAYDNGYDLGMAYLATGKLEPGRQLVRSLIKTKDTAELHNLLAQIEEKDGNYLVAVNEFETAAHQEPSETNIFDWGSELLLHRTLEPAIEVFRKAAERYPNSPRIAIGLGIALYSRGNYDEALQALLRASDLSPSDPRCYFFLSKAYDSSPSQADQVIQRFRRFSELQPANARAYYYYAMSLWKGKRAQDPDLDRHQIETLLQKAVSLDPKLADAQLQLGNLYSDQARYGNAIPQYQAALAVNPDLADAHYRLAQAYVHTSAKEKAQEQFAIYQKLRAQQMAELDKQIADIRQFVYSEEGKVPAQP